MEPLKPELYVVLHECGQADRRGCEESDTCRDAIHAVDKVHSVTRSEQPENRNRKRPPVGKVPTVKGKHLNTPHVSYGCGHSDARVSARASD